MDIKICLCCKKTTTPSEMTTYPLAFSLPNTFEPLSNEVFCSSSCTKRYLMGKETYLQTLYALYAGGNVIIPAIDPLLLPCHVISSTEYPKKCVLCSDVTYTPHSYVLTKQKGLYKLGNLAFCKAPCIRKWIKLNLEPYFFDLFEEYCEVVFHNTHVRGIAQDPRQLKCHQRVPQADSLTLEEFHQNYFYPSSGLPPDQYFTTIIYSQ